MTFLLKRYHTNTDTAMIFNTLRDIFKHFSNIQKII